MGGNVGRVVGGLDFKKKTADVVLTVTDVRSSEQVAMAEGSAKKTDIGWGAGGSLFTGSHWGGGVSISAMDQARIGLMLSRNGRAGGHIAVETARASNRPDSVRYRWWCKW